MRLITLHLPEPYIKLLDEGVSKGLAPNRATIIRDLAIRDFLKAQGLWRKIQVSPKLMDAILKTKE